MVKIKPFKGIYYNTKKIKNLDTVMSPPYDIITPEIQDHLHDKNPYNIVRLIFGKQQPDDNHKKNKYTRAATLFDKWQKENVLIKSDKPAIYPYAVEYTTDNKQKTMHGFFVLLKLDPKYKEIRAHEKTLSKPKEDRLRLMRTCKANLEPIELLYIDEQDEIKIVITNNITDPIIDVIGYDGFRHKLWKIENDNVIDQITNKLKNKILFIADGHHRYQTAINYAHEMSDETSNYTKDTPYNYRMVVLANIFDKGLSILPTHRLIKLPPNLKINELLDKLEKHFNIEKKVFDPSSKDEDTRGKEIINAIKTKYKHMFGMYHKETYYILTLKDKNIMDTFASKHSTTWRTLDVSILHKIILEKLIGIIENNLEDHVKYTRNDADAVKLVDQGKFDLSFVMNPTKINELKDVANAGEHMPQKSTYFLPKLLSGLIIRKIER